MPTDGTAYLVVRRDDGFGDVFPLVAADRYTLGRAATNRIVLKDELCSREHAEVFRSNDCWRVRDLNSLNGTRVNGVRLDGESELTPGDDVHLGTHAPAVRRGHEPAARHADRAGHAPGAGQAVAISKRLGQTRFLTPRAARPRPVRNGVGGHRPAHTSAATSRCSTGWPWTWARRRPTRNCAASSSTGCWRRSRPRSGGRADGQGGRRPASRSRQPTGHRDPSVTAIPAARLQRVSEYVSNEVLHSREAMLAEDVARDRYLRNRESLHDLGITSLICAPIAFGERMLGLIHLYCTDPHKALDGEDLEFAVAVAKQLGNVIHQMQRQESLAAENRLAARPAARRERTGRRQPGHEGDRAADRPRRRDQRHLS